MRGIYIGILWVKIAVIVEFFTEKMLNSWNTCHQENPIWKKLIALLIGWHHYRVRVVHWSNELKCSFAARDRISFHDVRNDITSFFFLWCTYKLESHAPILCDIFYFILFFNKQEASNPINSASTTALCWT